MKRETRQSAFMANLFFTKKQGLIHPLGGKVNLGEVVTAGFKREILEETGYKLQYLQFYLLFKNILDVAEIPEIWNQNFFLVHNITLKDLKASGEVKEIFELKLEDFVNSKDGDLTPAAQALRNYYKKLLNK